MDKVHKLNGFVRRQLKQTSVAETIRMHQLTQTAWADPGLDDGMDRNEPISMHNYIHSSSYQLVF